MDEKSKFTNDLVKSWVENGDASLGAIALPEDVRSFIYRVTLLLQANRSATPKQMDAMFQDAYKLYVRYDVEGRAND